MSAAEHSVAAATAHARQRMLTTLSFASPSERTLLIALTLWRTGEHHSAVVQ